MKRVLVCGGRDYHNRKLVESTLDSLSQEIGRFVVVCGGASGADFLAHQWAVNKDYPRWVFPAEWAVFGASAGPRRNVEMLKEAKPEYVVAFQGGAGTDNMIEEARRHGVPVQIVKDVWDV